MALRDTSYFNWQTKFIFGPVGYSSGSSGIKNFTYKNVTYQHQGSSYFLDAAFDSSGTMYVCGTVRATKPISGSTSDNYYWVVLKSADEWKSYTVSDLFNDDEENTAGSADRPAIATSMAVDQNDYIYVTGCAARSGSVVSSDTSIIFARRSTDKGSTWQTVFCSGSGVQTTGGDISSIALKVFNYKQYKHDGTISSSNDVWIGGGSLSGAAGSLWRWVTFKSIDGSSGSFTQEDTWTNSGSTGPITFASCMAAPQDDVTNSKKGWLLVGGTARTADNGFEHAFRVFNGISTWTQITGLQSPLGGGTIATGHLLDMVTVPSGSVVGFGGGSKIVVAGMGDSGEDGMIWMSDRAAPTAPNHWNCIMYENNYYNAADLTIDPSNALNELLYYYGCAMEETTNKSLYFVGTARIGSNKINTVRFYSSGNLADVVATPTNPAFSVMKGTTWSDTDYGVHNELLISSRRIKIGLNKDKFGNSDLWVLGFNQGNVASIIRKGHKKYNKQNLGPRMLNSSFGYVHEEISGSVVERFKLNNISEFPHSEGMYQMKSIVLGTQDSGKVGKTDDSIVQVNHIGSFVKVLWPKQDQDVFVKGFGDFAIGQKPGKLSTEWQSGEFIDVSKDNFDHVSLYCYALKANSGSQDSILVRVERRPLRSTGFGVEQAVEHIISGSYVESIYRDQLHRKDVDYGDLSIKEVTFPIDISLTNVKDFRVSAKMKNGQSSDENRNFVIWARLIKSNKNHEET